MIPNLASLSDDQLHNLSTAYSTASASGIDPNIATSLVWQESNGKTHPGDGGAGAVGPAQLEPGTANDLGVDINDPAQNVQGGMKYLKQQIQKYGDTPTALMAYNWGPGNVDKWIQNGRDMSQVPDETLHYVNNIISSQPQQTPAAPTAPQDLSSIPTDQLQKMSDDWDAQHADHSGVSDQIGSTANSIGAGLAASNPVSQGLGAVVGGLTNSAVNAYTGVGDVNPLKTIPQAWDSANQDMASAQQANPNTFAAAKFAEQATPFLATGGIAGALPRAAANAGIGAGEAIYNGGSPHDIALSAAMGPAGELLNPALSGVRMGANFAGNSAGKATNLFKTLGSGVAKGVPVKTTLADMLTKNPAAGTTIKSLGQEGLETLMSGGLSPYVIQTLKVKYGTAAASAMIKTLQNSPHGITILKSLAQTGAAQ